MTLSELRNQATAIREGIAAMGAAYPMGNFNDARFALQIVEQKIMEENGGTLKEGKCLLIGNFESKHFDCPEGWRDGVVTNVITGAIVSTAGVSK